MTPVKLLTSSGSAKNRYLLLSLMVAPFLFSLDTTALVTAMPVVAQNLDTTLSLASLTYILYFLIIAGLTLPLGRLMDRFDAFILLRIGYCIFFAGSLFCALSNGIGELCIGRMIQGFGGAVLYSAAPVLVKRSIGKKFQNLGFISMAMAFQAGSFLGAPLGGYLASSVGWRTIFYIDMPIILAGFVLLSGKKTHSDHKEQSLHFDMPGIGLSFIAIISFIIGLNQGKEQGWTSPFIIASLVVFIACFLLFIRREKRCQYPMIDLTLFKKKQFNVGTIILSIMLVTVSGISFLMPFYLINQFGYKIEKVGLLLVLDMAAAFITGLILAPRANHYRKRLLVCSGLIIYAVSIAGFILIISIKSSLLLVSFLILSGVGFGMISGPILAFIEGTMESEQVARGNAFLSVLRIIMQMLGVLIYETIFSQISHFTLIGSPLEMMPSFIAVLSIGAVSLVILSGYSMKIKG
jgi:MFS family permease